MKHSKPTCGPMYKEALEKYAGTLPANIKVFAAGFVSGQAEKVYLGACRAAMFRPSQARQSMLLGVVEDVAERYGLVVVQPIGAKKEIWICRPCWKQDVEALREWKEDSQGWHEKRAWLCGVPPQEIDRQFHERAGHGERCD